MTNDTKLQIQSIHSIRIMPVSFNIRETSKFLNKASLTTRLKNLGNSIAVAAETSLYTVYSIQYTRTQMHTDVLIHWEWD